MTEEELNKLSDAYVDAYKDDESPGETHPSYWAIEKFTDLEFEYPEDCWQGILLVMSKNPSRLAQAKLASGPLEELLELHGDKVIDRVEQQAQDNPEFKRLLHGVFAVSNKKIWERVQRARLDG